MGGIGRTLACLPAARAFLAGAALLAGVATAKAQAQPDDTAMAIPRQAPRAGGVALPRPLDPVEAARIRRIFAAQHHGRLSIAWRESERLDTSTPLGAAMLGHMLADRYLGRFYRPGAAELAGWLTRWSDLPDAPAIYALLRKRLPRRAAMPPPPPAPAALPSAAVARPAVAPPVAPVAEAAEPEHLGFARNPLLDRTVHARAAAGHQESALRLIAHTRGIGTAYRALLLAEVAQASFTQNDDDTALDLAAAALQSDGEVGLAGYVAGLAAWRLGRPEDAQPFFEAAATAAIGSPSLHAGGSFWAARAHLHADDPAGYLPWMQRAARQPRTFYGLLARRALGIGSGFGPARGTLGEADIEAVAATPEGLSAFALLQVGQTARAEAELRRLAARSGKNPGFGRALMLVAATAGLPGPGMAGPAMEGARPSRTANGFARDDAEFPLPSLQPRNGFRVDPALVYALTRVESNFDTAAVSSAGARGLMQIMPVTASYVVGDAALADEAGEGLDDPAINLDLGQRYVLDLARDRVVGGDLIRLLASYNAGPGHCASWRIRDGGDPLLFIEAIPIGETRLFVQRALAYTWIYAARLHLPAPSLDELAGGAFPRFRPAAAAAAEAVPHRRRRRH